MENNCLVCNSNFSISLGQVGNYIQGKQGITVLKCQDCDSHFIKKDDLDFSIYDIIYQNPENIAGYNRYTKYSLLIGDELKKLSILENNYYPIWKILNEEKNKDKINVLEVGCGLGYITNAINKVGISCLGIDISNESILKATKKYGNYYQRGSLNNFTSQDKYDYIIATELIEHVESPFEFVEIAKKLLKEKGKIILTTPNKSFYSNKSIRIGDLPPVHTTRITEKGFQNIAYKLGLNLDFFDMAFINNSDNLLFEFIVNKINQNILNKYLSYSHFIIEDQDSHKSIISQFTLAISKLSKFYPIRVLSNFIYRSFSRRTTQMCIILSK